jgi:hypothetical protein
MGRWCGGGRVETNEVGIIYVPSLHHTSLPLGTPLQVQLDPPSTHATRSSSSLLTGSVVSFPTSVASSSNTTTTTTTTTSSSSSSSLQSTTASVMSSSTTSSLLTPLSSALQCEGILKIDRKGHYWVRILSKK